MDLQQQIVELREKFLQKLEDEPPADERGFHPDDLARVRSKDDWLKRFLEHSEFNLQEALTMLWSTCEWRRKVGANEITEDNVRRDYLEDGVFFSYGKDKDGKTMFIIKSKLHTKGARDFSELQRCIIYWFERLEREGNDQISLFFDMCEAGLSNMDMEFTKYLINLFKFYYPNFLNYIILLELPWVLNAALKIIKSWLPAKAIPKIKQVNKSSLKEYVDPSVALKCWGGTNDWTFTFTPEVRNVTVNGKVDNKKVHFSEASPLNEQPPSGFGDQNQTEETMLAVTPDVISFNKDGQEIGGTIVVKNQTADKCISYKIKTTAPEKFRVRKSNGTLLPAQQVTVTVSLQTGFNLRSLLHNDKFLVMCLPIKDTKMTTDELADFWKTNGKGAEQHRVWCRDGTNGATQSILSSSSPSTERTIDHLYTKLTHIEDCHSKLHKEMRTLKHVMIISIIWSVLAAIAIIYILRSDIGQIPNGDDSCHMHRG